MSPSWKIHRGKDNHGIPIIRSPPPQKSLPPADYLPVKIRPARRSYNGAPAIEMPHRGATLVSSPPCPATEQLQQLTRRVFSWRVDSTVHDVNYVTVCRSVSHRHSKRSHASFGGSTFQAASRIQNTFISLALIPMIRSCTRSHVRANQLLSLARHVIITGAEWKVSGAQ